MIGTGQVVGEERSGVAEDRSGDGEASLRLRMIVHGPGLDSGMGVGWMEGSLQGQGVGPAMGSGSGPPYSALQAVCPWGLSSHLGAEVRWGGCLDMGMGSPRHWPEPPALVHGGGGG